ncbi:MAG: hypothetical protein AB1481_04460 [Candidatus Omnitrophota bacterium]
MLKNSCAEKMFLVFVFLGLIAFAKSSLSEENFVYSAADRRNPFIPLVTPDGRLLQMDKGEEISSLSIEGIIYDRYGESFAVVDGSIVKIGDRIRDYQVLRIEKEKVIFVKDGQPVELSLKE